MRGAQLWLVLCLLMVAPSWARELIELKAQTRIAKNESAVFKLKTLSPSLQKIRLRYKMGDEDDFKWVDFEARSGDELQATIDKSLISGALIVYYIVWQKKDGSVEALYGSPQDPLKIQVDLREQGALLHAVHEKSPPQKAALHMRERFDDDDLDEQIAVFSASDEEHRNDQQPFSRRLGTKIGLERIEQMGVNDLVDLLQRLERFEFLSDKSGRLEPYYEGIPARARLTLFVDDLELKDEFDGSVPWDLDAQALGAVHVLPGALLQSVHVDTPRTRGVAVKLRGGFPEDESLGFSTGQALGPFEGDWSGGLRRREDLTNMSSVMRLEWRPPGERAALVKGHFAFLGRMPHAALPNRFLWKAALSLALPSIDALDTHMRFEAGQVIQEAALKDQSRYHLWQWGMGLTNRLRLFDSQTLQLNARVALIGLAPEPFHYDGAFELVPCAFLGSSSKALQNCRLESVVLFSDQIQIARVVGLTVGFQTLWATQEANNLASLLHPFVDLQIAPFRPVDFSFGFSSSGRWPTLIERYAFAGAQNQIGGRDEPLLPEKLRQIYAGARLRFASEYAHLSLDMMARQAWLDDLIGRAALLDGNAMWRNRGDYSFWALSGALVAKLAAANQVYMGSEFHTRTTPYQNYKIILGTRLNWGDLGSSHIEVQTPSRFHILYQSRPFWEHFIFETQFSGDDRLFVQGKLKLFL